MKELFAAGETIRSRRLLLSALSVRELPVLSAWLPSALAPEWLLLDLERAIEAGCGVYIASRDGEPLGAAVALLETPVAGAASIPFLAIDPAQRFRGLGGEAGLALERHLRARAGAQRVLAPVPDGRGLAVYFWLRLGYRPLLRCEAPWPLASLNANPAPGIWLARDQP